MGLKRGRLMKAREGDFIETQAGLIFDVKGLVHPPDRIIAFPRFVPNQAGERRNDEKSYGKMYSLAERFKFLKQAFPQYLIHDTVFDETLCEVPFCDVGRQYKPAEKLQQLLSSKCLDTLETLALQLAESLKNEANIELDMVGVSGSILVGLHKTDSDIDPVIYGSRNCRKVRDALQSLLKTNSSPFKPYYREELKALFDFRSKDTMIRFEDFVRTESRKDLQGKFHGADYFVRFVKDWNEVKEKYGDVHYVNVGYAKLRATVVDDSESIFTPCSYKLSNVQILEGPKAEPIEEIASFRGRFCEQLRQGETVVAQGKIERVIDRLREREYFRLLLGNRPSDFMILAKA
jgi:predicted nucleotidyltransferase